MLLKPNRLVISGLTYNYVYNQKFHAKKEKNITNRPDDVRK